MLYDSMARLWSNKEEEEAYLKIRQPEHRGCSAFRLCLDAVFAAEHVVYILKIVNPACNGLGIACWSVVLLQMGLLAEFTHLCIDQ